MIELDGHSLTLTSLVAIADGAELVAVAPAAAARIRAARAVVDRHAQGDEPVYGIYRQGRTYVDPVTREVLGINADDIGTGQRIGEEGDITTLRLTRSTQEIRIADRLFSTEERTLTSSFVPSEPLQTIDGLILDVPRGVTQIGQYDVVTLNKGRRDGLSEGNVLAIYKTGETVRDRLTGEQVKIPDERAGLLMVFRAYDKLSYGLILQATRQMAVLDKIRNP